MALIVQKYGGSSVSDADAIRRVANRIVRTRNAGHQLVVVVSAMGDTTDELLDKAAELTSSPPPREMDILLTSGERISMALLAMAINEMGVPAASYSGAQAGVRTDTSYGKASIIGLVPERVARSIQDGQVAIVAGFQGINKYNDDTTLGRGGSDTTAVALAQSLQADVCEIYTDVDGMFSADPRLVPTAHQIKSITYDEALELSAHGAKILHHRAVEFARRYRVPLHVRSSFSTKPGTWITNRPIPKGVPDRPTDSTVLDDSNKEAQMEGPIISGIAHDSSQDKITVRGVPDQPGKAAELFSAVAASGANIDMIVQNTAMTPGSANISFTVPAAEAAGAMEFLRAHQKDIGFQGLRHDPDIGILSLVGAGMRTNTGVSARLFRALSEAGVNIQIISTSEIRISVVTNLADLERAVVAVHSAFGLDADQIEAVVYGGTGR